MLRTENQGIALYNAGENRNLNANFYQWIILVIEFWIREETPSQIIFLLLFLIFQASLPQYCLFLCFKRTYLICVSPYYCLVKFRYLYVFFGNGGVGTSLCLPQLFHRIPVISHQQRPIVTPLKQMQINQIAFFPDGIWTRWSFTL